MCISEKAQEDLKGSASLNVIQRLECFLRFTRVRTSNRSLQFLRRENSFSAKP